jgi:hypothetical protein
LWEVQSSRSCCSKEQEQAIVWQGRATLTPGSYRLSVKTGKSKERPERLHRDIIHRQSYTEQKTKVAIRLVQEDGLTILMAARFANDRKLEAYV